MFRCHIKPIESIEVDETVSRFGEVLLPCLIGLGLRKWNCCLNNNNPWTNMLAIPPFEYLRFISLNINFQPVNILTSVLLKHLGKCKRRHSNATHVKAVLFLMALCIGIITATHTYAR